MLKKIPLSALLFFPLAVFCFFKADTRANSVEKRIYTHYTVSLVRDLDLNVVNQIPAKEAWLLTSTFNYPDMHSNGVSVMWAPFFAAAKLLNANFDEDSLARLAQTAAGIFWGLLCLPLLWRLLRFYFRPEVAGPALLLSLLCTPFWWFALYQPENADITSLFVALVLLNLYVRRREFDPAFFAFLGGIGLFFAFAVKVDLIFYALLFAHFLFESRRLKTALAFFAGAALMLTPVILNETLKNGFFNYAYLDTVTSDIYLLSENLLGPSGYFRLHPFYALVLAFFVFFAVRRRAGPEFWIFLAVPVAEILIESYTFNHNEAYGARHWVNDTGCFALLLGFVLSSFSSRRLKAGFYSLCGLSFFVSVLGASVYRLEFPVYYNGGNWLHVLHNRDLGFWLGFADWPLKAAAWIPYLLLAVLVTAAARGLSTCNRPARLFVFLALGAAAYWGATALNLSRNELSAKQVPELIGRAVIGKGPHINSFYENAGCLQRAEAYYRQKGDVKAADDRRKLLEMYVARSAEEIVSDPVGFKATLVPGRGVYVPDHLWDDQ